MFYSWKFLSQFTFERKLSSVSLPLIIVTFYCARYIVTATSIQLFIHFIMLGCVLSTLFVQTWWWWWWWWLRPVFHVRRPSLQACHSTRTHLWLVGVVSVCVCVCVCVSSRRSKTAVSVVCSASTLWQMTTRVLCCCTPLTQRSHRRLHRCRR